jgi:type IV pilus assembly protein PilQ
VTTLDNTAAKISQGISIPFTTATDEKIETSSIDYDLQLEVTPHVTSDESVMLTINITKNAPSTTFVAVDSLTPAIETREAQTQVLVRDGETTVIGGIITDSVSDTGSGVPWFQNIPFVGWMFKTKVNITQKTELIIFITPKIVRLGKVADNK